MKDRYTAHSGIEGINPARDVVTGFRRLRMRGIKAAAMALNLKPACWNISAEAELIKNRRRKAAVRGHEGRLGKFFARIGAMPTRLATHIGRNRAVVEGRHCPKLYDVC